jgi:small basic protein
MNAYLILAEHMAAGVAAALTFMLVLGLRLYLLWRASSLQPWQRWLGSLIDSASYLLYRIAEALLIAILVGLFTETGVVERIVNCIHQACVA